MKPGRKRIDLAGKRFGCWVVITYVESRKPRWLCICDCGARVAVLGDSLRRGASKSCGCLRRARATKHGMSRSREYRAWQRLKQRCFNPRNSSYEYYGDRGILPCESWTNSFEEYFADTGPCPAGCSLDRIDVNGPYAPWNVRWSDAKQQAQNRRPQRARAAVKRRRLEQAKRLPPSLDDPPF
jgi:hypothetical protein